MSQSGEILKLRILLCFLQAGERCTVSRIARTLGEEKYSVSRSLGELEREGLLDRSNPRRPLLTQLGQQRAWKDAKRVERLTDNLVYEGVSLEHARRDALQMALYCSEPTLNAMIRTEQMVRLKDELGELRQFSGTRLCGQMRDGVYPLPFALYSMGPGGSGSPVRNDWGFARYCNLSVKDGRGRVQLRAIPLKHGENGDAGRTRVRHLMYFSGGEYIYAENNGGIFSFPAGALEFVVLGGEGCRIFHGSVNLQLDQGSWKAEERRMSGLFTLLL